MTNSSTKKQTETVNRSKFIDIADRKEELVAIATEWQNKKSGSKGLTPLCGQNNSFVVGLLGELIYARLVGLEHEINLEYQNYGDGGIDFKRNKHITVDVKTGTSGRTRLIENKTVNTDTKSTKHPDKWAKYFVLVELNEEQTGGWVVGWTTKERLLNGNVRELRKGEGERYIMNEDELNPFDTEINYLFNLHKLSQNIPESELTDYLTKKRKADYATYHEDYQQKVKAGQI